MRIDYTNKLTGMERFGCLVLFFFEDKLSPPAEAPREAAREVRRIAVLKDFTGKTGQTQVLPLGSGKIERVLCVGLGKAKATGKGRAKNFAISSTRSANDRSYSSDGPPNQETVQESGGYDGGGVNGREAEVNGRGLPESSTVHPENPSDSGDLNGRNGENGELQTSLDLGADGLVDEGAL